MNLFFLNSERNMGGVERWMLRTAQHLVPRGHRCFFSGRESSLFLDRCSTDGYPTLPLHIRSDYSLVNSLKIANYLKTNEIDIIITNLNKDTRLAGMANKIYRRAVLVGRNGLPIVPNNLTYKITYPWLADAVIAPSNSIRDCYAEYGWVPPDFVEVIPNGIERQTQIQFDRHAVLKKHRLPDQFPIVGIFGRLVAQKQHMLFMDIARNVLNDWPDAAFMVVGDGPLYDDIFGYATELGISQNVFMLGYQTDVMPLYSVCDLVVHTSDHEGLPNVVLEAMFAERAVVAFDSGGTRELISDENVGIVVPPGDIYLMTQKILELLMLSDQRIRIGKAARERILEGFTVEKMVDHVESFFTALITRKRTRTNAEDNQSTRSQARP